MMETQKILKPAGKIIIISDYREQEVIGHLKKLDATVNERSLEVGDFIISDDVVIERKTHSDFISSIIDGRIFEQSKCMKENFNKSIVIIEGHSDRQINDSAFKAAVASLLVDFNVSLLNTKNPFDTAKTIYWIAKKEQEENKHAISFKVGKKPKEMKQLQEAIVSSLPGISTVISKRLLEHFGNVENIFTADENELRKVKGIGIKLADRIRKIVNEKYRDG
jgi:Fanconi anemia group M protein